MPPRGAERPVYSLVIPIYNEEAVLPILLHRLDRLLERLDGPAEVIIVDDGSRDAGGIVAAGRANDDPRYRYLALSRNFGHQIAITAGMDAAAGDAVIVMDADLQDPPEVVLELIAKWKEGFEIVYARRLTREGESRFKRWTASLFYRFLRLVTAVDIPADVGDFRLVDRKALEAFRTMPERHRFVRGMFAWMGFRQTAASFHRLPRLAGHTGYSWPKMVRLALDGVVSFSDAPLRLALWLGSAVSFGALAYGAYVVWLSFHDAALITGWASTVVLLSLLSGVNLLMTGVVGLYVGRIHSEVKNRPLYLVGRAVGFPATPPGIARDASARSHSRDAFRGAPVVRVMTTPGCPSQQSRSGCAGLDGRLGADHGFFAPPAASYGGRLGIRVHPVFFFLSLLVLLSSVSEKLLQDPDSHWHIAVGRWIWDAGTLPWNDSFSHTFAGAPWIAKDWLSQLLFYGAHALAGWWGVACLAAVVIAASFTLLFRWLRGRIHPTVALAVALLAVMLSAGSLIARPHVLALPFLILWTGDLMASLERRSPRPALPAGPGDDPLGQPAWKLHDRVRAGRPCRG